MSLQPVFIGNGWRESNSGGSFRAENPATGELLPAEFPVSTWADCEAVLDAATRAAAELRRLSPEKIAKFLVRYAERLDRRVDELVNLASLETGLPRQPRLAEVELPRTTDQLRQGAAAVLEGSWALPTIDTRLNIRSLHAPLGPVLIFGPNNFPFAYNGVSGGDFVAAIATGNPVIAKAHPSHPGTTKLLAEEAFAALNERGLPAGTVQMLYHLTPEDGLRMVADKRLAAVGFTGSRAAGLKLKAAADAIGKPIYLEMSSVNPVVMLPGALKERGAELVDEFTESCLMAVGQFCTSPGIVILFEGREAEQFICDVKAKLAAAPVGTLLSSGVLSNLAASIKVLQTAGAELIAGGFPLPPPARHFANTLLRASGGQFLSAPKELQTEAFGNASLMVVVRDAKQAAEVIAALEGNLTGSIYSDTTGRDEAVYAQLAPLLRARVGRFLNDRMPTGVAVTAAMNHGGPFPATGHPGFTAVGIPAALHRFTMLQCFDHVRPERLPPALQDKNPNGRMWRWIDGTWTQKNVGDD
jgi:alpha-ketoglutaric semialdehyde dehydrogenase